MRLDLQYYRYKQSVFPYEIVLEQSFLKIKKTAGDYAGEATPVPIPNTVVKLSEADGTYGATRRESRKSPALHLKRSGPQA